MVPRTSETRSWFPEFPGPPSSPALISGPADQTVRRIYMQASSRNRSKRSGRMCVVPHGTGDLLTLYRGHVFMVQVCCVYIVRVCCAFMVHGYSGFMVMYDLFLRVLQEFHIPCSTHHENRPKSPKTDSGTTRIQHFRVLPVFVHLHRKTSTYLRFPQTILLAHIVCNFDLLFQR